MARRTNNSTKRNRSVKPAWGPWADLDDNLLFLILIRLGLIDYLAFGGVCKSWRSLALSNRKTFMAGKEPLQFILSKRSFTLVDIFDERRRYNAVIPGLYRGFCVGVSCGYVIMLKKNRNKLCVVHPITRHELHFPDLPKKRHFSAPRLRPILVYSSLLSKFIIVVSYRFNCLLFCGYGDSKWIELNPGNNWDIVDLAFYDGKIYLLNCNGSIGEMRLNPSPSLHLLNDKGVHSRLQPDSREFVTSGQRLFMVDRCSRIIVKHELDFEKMEWVVRGNLEKETLFISSFKFSSVVNSTNCRAQCNSIYIISPADADGWYFPHECDNRNLLKDS